MRRCIYCREIMLVKGESGDRRLRSSREHIIPSALGGPDALSTFDVCEGCNSTLGKTTDGDLMKEQLVSVLRQRFGIPGYSGKIPDVVMKATSMQTGAAFDMTIPHAGDVTYTAPPIVNQIANPDGTEQFEVRGSREQVAGILRGKQAKMDAAGRRMVHPDGTEMDSIEDSIAAAAAQVTTEFKARVVVNETVIRRGIIKIAFGFAHLVLGSRWTFSLAATPLRDAALGQGSGDDVAAIVTGVDVAIRHILLPTEGDRDVRHLVALIPSADRPLVVVSLFGEPLLTMGVHLQVTADQMTEGIAATNRMMVSTLPKGGDVLWVGLVEFTRRWTVAGGVQPMPVAGP